MSDEEADAAALKQLLADVSETRHELVAMRSWLMAKPEAKESSYIFNVCIFVCMDHDLC